MPERDGRALLQRLQRLPFGDAGKPDPRENILDVLEVMAVAAGQKPAHLQGQGMRSDAVINELERIAKDFGLMTERTRGLAHYCIREPVCDPTVLTWIRNNWRDEHLSSPDVLWVYSDAALLPLIHETVDGARSTAATLGYPECCVKHADEEKVLVLELYVKGLAERYRTSAADELIALWKQNADVNIQVPDTFIDVEGSQRVFPYVGFTACPGCIAGGERSAAGQLNRRMRDLAFAVDDNFGRQIWNQRDLLAKRGRPVGRNDRCPCGSGKKFKVCCGR